MDSSGGKKVPLNLNFQLRNDGVVKEDFCMCVCGNSLTVVLKKHKERK